MCVNGVLISGQNTQFEKFRILPSISVLLYIILSYGYSSKSGQDSQFLNYNIKVSAERHDGHGEAREGSREHEGARCREGGKRGCNSADTYKQLRN